MNFDCNGYLANGIKVFIKDCPIENPDNAVAEMLAFTSKLLADGLTLEIPGLGKLEAGHKREQIDGILRRKDQKNSDGTMSPTFDLYPDNPALGRRCLIINLDTQEEVDEFETVTGYKVSDFKVYVAQQLNRKEDPNDYREYAKPITQPLWVVFKDNPAYDPNAEKKKRQHVFIRWETAPPQPAAAPAAVGIPSAKVDPRFPDAEAERAYYANLEAEDRRKAASNLVNEAVTIYKVTYKPTRNGMGVPHWEALAHDINNASLPIEIGEQGADIIREFYEWPAIDAENLAIDVITEIVNGKRRIKSALPPAGTDTAQPLEEVLERLPSATQTQSIDAHDAVLQQFLELPIAKGWGEVRKWLLKHVYTNKSHMENSIAKWGKETNNWQGMTSGQVMSYLANRHKEEKADIPA